MGPGRPPWIGKETKATEENELTNFGVDTGKLNGQSQESFRINGREVSRQALLEAVAGPLADDSHKLRLTIIGSDQERKAVLDDLARSPLLSELTDRYLLQDYRPDHWAVSRSGFVRTGTPTIYLQHPGGQVLHRQDDYDGPEPLAQALRKADPSYVSRKDPDLRKPSGIPWSKIPPPVWLLAAGVLFLLFKRGQP